MTHATPRPGGCLCGAVRFIATPSAPEFHACHCAICRRWASGPFLGVDCGDQLEIEDETHLGVYRSSDWAERCFCAACGTSLFTRMVEAPHYVVSLEAFDDTQGLKFSRQIWVEAKSPRYSFAERTKMMTGDEVIAEYMASQGKSENG